jgi:hypothetical protein
MASGRTCPVSKLTKLCARDAMRGEDTRRCDDERCERSTRHSDPPGGPRSHRP